MKAFYIIILVFFIMIGGILINRIHVNDFAVNATEKLFALQIDGNISEAKIKELTNSISKELDKLEFSIPRKKVNQIHDYAKLLETQYRLSAIADFEVTRELLIAQLREIKEAESISFSNIF